MSSKNELPGMVGKGVEQVSIDAVNDAIVDYVKLRDLRIELLAKEVDAKVVLITVLRDNAKKIGVDKDGSIVYRHDALVVTLRHGKDELKVKNTANEENED
jgi:hypothetical protein